MENKPTTPNLSSNKNISNIFNSNNSSSSTPNSSISKRSNMAVATKTYSPSAYTMSEYKHYQEQLKREYAEMYDEKYSTSTPTYHEHQTALSFLYNHNRSNPASPVYKSCDPGESTHSFEQTPSPIHIPCKPETTTSSWQPTPHKTEYTYGKKLTKSTKNDLSKWDKYIYKINNYIETELDSFCLVEKNNVSYRYESNLNKDEFIFVFRFKGIPHKQECQFQVIRNNQIIWTESEKTPKRIYYALKEYVDDIYFHESLNLYKYNDF